MIIVADIGNTNITLGIFNGKNLEYQYTIFSSLEKRQDEYITELTEINLKYPIDKCLLGSVSDETLPKFKHACDSVFQNEAIIIDRKSFDGLCYDVKYPQTIGIDRLANVYAFKDKYTKPVIVIDAGTAVTFDILTNGNTFSGGIIMAGIRTQLRALNLYTSKLPQVEIKDSIPIIGKTTEENILSGVVQGLACSVDGLIEKCENELGSNAIIAGCGGDIEIISKYMKRNLDIKDTAITLKGLLSTELY